MIAAGAANSLGVLIYTSGVAGVLFNGGKIFGKFTTFLDPLALLLLFVFSATGGSLVLGRPAYLYFNGEKEEGIRSLLYTMVWLFLFTLGAFGVLLSLR